MRCDFIFDSRPTGLKSAISSCKTMVDLGRDRRGALYPHREYPRRFLRLFPSRLHSRRSGAAPLRSAAEAAARTDRRAAHHARPSRETKKKSVENTDAHINPAQGGSGRAFCYSKSRSLFEVRARVQTASACTQIQGYEERTGEMKGLPRSLRLMDDRGGCIITRAYPLVMGKVSKTARLSAQRV